MKAFLFRIATPLTTGLFAVSLVSGVALFFHFGDGAFKGMHEWLSLVLVAPFALHLWRNWRPLSNYFRHGPMALSIALSLVAAVAFAVPALVAPGSGGPPQFAFAHQMLANAAAEVAPLLDETPESLVAMLAARGFTAAAPDLALSEIASRSGKSERELVAALVQPGA